jgi:hypothetical protein
MKISDALSNVTRLGIETSPFIYYAEQRQGYLEKMREVVALVEAGSIELAASTLLYTLELSNL